MTRARWPAGGLAFLLTGCGAPAPEQQAKDLVQENWSGQAIAFGPMARVEEHRLICGSTTPKDVPSSLRVEPEPFVVVFRGGSDERWEEPEVYHRPPGTTWGVPEQHPYYRYAPLCPPVSDSAL